MAKTIGLDIGDCQFRLAYLDGQMPKLIADELGRTVFPSKVSFLPGGGCRLGYEADLLGIPENTILHPMTLISKTQGELLDLNGSYAYEFVTGGRNTLINAHRVFVSPVEVLTALFYHAKQLAENFLHEAVENIVIAIPDGLDDPSRIRIKKAAVAAGLKIKQLLNQTTAAALGLKFDRGRKTRQIAVVDMGASHTSMSVIEAGNNRLDTLATKHCRVGTNHFQEGLARFISLAAIGHNIFTTHDQFLKNELMIEAGYALVELSHKKTVEVSIGGAGVGGRRAVININRDQFEQAIKSYLELIENEGIFRTRYRSFDAVIAIGGGANIPAVRTLITRSLGKDLFLMDKIDPSAVVALGAATKGGIIDGLINAHSVERTVHDLGTWYNVNHMDVLVPRGTELPFIRSKTYRQSPGPYRERVLQYVGSGNGQDRSESDPEVIALANKIMHLSGTSVKITITIDADGITEYKVTDGGSLRETILTGFSIG
ncbi:MAG: Hsp70 family protein [Candidatus Buchananbacteria bacterium]|nr:Hsp70 family protein [Candidatus Buchananbacteria bacterium]